VKLGARHIEQVMQGSLTQEERGQLQHSADAVRELVEAMERLKGVAAGTG